MSKKTKDFSAALGENYQAAMQFISSAEPMQEERLREERPAATIQPPIAKPVRPASSDSRFVAQREVKSRQVRLLMAPTVHDGIKGLAKARGKSVNDYVHGVFENIIKGEFSPNEYNLQGQGGG
jgi:hypothetical protein